MTTRPGIHLIMVALKPGDKPPARTVTCSKCIHWTGGRSSLVAACGQLGGNHPANFGCAYFQRRPELG